MSVGSSLGSASAAASTAAQTQSSQSSTSDPFQSLNTSSFVQLLVTELQNQDPTQPMDNSQILEEIGAIRSVDATTQLTNTLNSVLMGQNVATAGSLIGWNIQGVDNSGNSVNGTVNSVSLNGGVATLNVGTQAVSLSNVTQITPPTGT
ncbi:MAG: flagellar hook capping FlgD N-terminal domain-containing protein [Thermoguttaceae bacterium]|jgi:flagellar basal-body rod modification protein FlgD